MTSASRDGGKRALLPGHPLLQVDGVAKSFGGVRALDDVSLMLHSGSVLALVGENGAGKSTLLNVVSGVVAPDHGQVRFDGSLLRSGRAHDALARGIATVHQELTLFPNLTVWENVFAGHEDAGRVGRRLRPRLMIERTGRLLARLGVGVPPGAKVAALSLAQQQLVEVAKALSWNPRVLILDEATSALGQHQVQRLFGLVRELAARGTGTIFVSHRMPEVFAICDEALVLKDGRLAASFTDLHGVSENDLVEAMVGRSLSAVFPGKTGKTRKPSGAAVLVAEKLSGGQVQDVSLTVRAGEIVGLGGLQGHGQQDVLRLLFGISPVRGGTLTLGGRDVVLTNPRAAMAAGVAYVPPDRKTEGLLLPHAVEMNLTLPLLRRTVATRFGRLRFAAERQTVAELREQLRIRQRQWRQPVESLSGGNQQKVVLGKWLAYDYYLLLLDEPTRGVDVETKSEVYRLLRSLTDKGKAILVASTDSMELLGLCDRVYVIYEGRVQRELAGDALTEYELTMATLGVDAAEQEFGL